MDRQTRIALLIDHFKQPRHKRALPDADVRMPGGNPGCGDIVTIHLRTDGERIAEMTFEGEGCTISQAAASILSVRMNRKRPVMDAVLDMSYEEMIDLLGRDIVGSRPRCATLALGTLKAAVKRIQMDRKLRAAGHSEDEIERLRSALTAQAAGSGLVFGDRAAAAARKESGSTRSPESPPGSGDL